MSLNIEFTNIIKADIGKSANMAKSANICKHWQTLATHWPHIGQTLAKHRRNIGQTLANWYKHLQIVSQMFERADKKPHKERQKFVILKSDILKNCCISSSFSSPGDQVEQRRHGDLGLIRERLHHAAERAPRDLAEPPRRFR